MKLYRTQRATLLERDGALPESKMFTVDELFRGDAPADWAARFTESEDSVDAALAPLESQEVSTAGESFYFTLTELEADVWLMELER